MTVAEYCAASRRRRWQYRLVRNPLVLFIVAPFFVFVVKQRFASSEAVGVEYRSVWWTNLALLCIAAPLSWIFGVWPYVLIQSIGITVAGSAGLWLFYIQHQFEGVYWERSDNWDYTAAALQGSSFYKLPKVLQWFSGNIGFHHIHHLSTRIPNYNLQSCHEGDRLFQQVKPITLWLSLRAPPLRLWDEESKRLVGYAHIHQFERQRPCTGK